MPVECQRMEASRRSPQLNRPVFKRIDPNENFFEVIYEICLDEKKKNGLKFGKGVFSMFALFIVATLIKIICMKVLLGGKHDAEETQNFSPQALQYRKLLTNISDAETFDKLETFAASLPYMESYSEPDVHENLSSNLKYPEAVSSKQCDLIPVNMRFDCLLGSDDSPRETCELKGCCWKEVHENEVPPRSSRASKLYSPNTKEGSTNLNGTGNLNVPYCFYPQNYFLYNFSHVEHSDHGIKGSLIEQYKSGFPRDVPTLSVEIRFETCTRLRIRISDANRKRWETPLPLVPKRAAGCQGTKLYSIDLIEQDGTFVISRNGSGVPLFDTRNAAPLTFADQFLQLSTILPSPYVYGLGQHLDGLLLDIYWKRRVLWNADLAPKPGANLYGSHPFYMVMEPSGASHGVFLLNSNAMDVLLQPTPALTFRVIGGILDFYVFMGPSPDEVISQYTEVIGRPFLPPYWSLGYHQCRFGYNNLDRTRKVWKRTKDAGIPFDVQWNDIDYMVNQNDFTYDKERFAGLPQFAKELHESGMHYVIITDPGISATEKPGTYPPFDLGIKDNIFIRNSTGQLFIGKVWNPNGTVFPDFTRPNAVIYWSYIINKFHSEVEFDGLWIDMNEPSNFWSGQRNGCPKSSLENPPYLPPVEGGLMYYKTLCMTAKQFLGPHYNLHNLYGITEAISTNIALRITDGIVHPFIISRSTFPGTGAFAGHWTGDVQSDWFNLWKSIGDVLTFNILGVPMVGADICGFNGNTTVALCNRWMQLGAFYPFSRNHNTDDGIDQDPVALGELVVRSSRKALLQRYTLLPYLYSLFFRAHLRGIPVAKPLFFKYPQDTQTYNLDTQFLWGESLMVVPVLEENATSVLAYFPEGKWYDWYTGKRVSKYGNEYISLPAPLDTIPLMVADASILPCQNPGNTTTESRKNSFGLVVALNELGQAYGELYWADVNTPNAPEQHKYIHWKFRAVSSQIFSEVAVYEESTDKLTLGWIKIFGISSKVFWVTVNGQNVKYSISAVTQVMRIDDLAVDFLKPVAVAWGSF